MKKLIYILLFAFAITGFQACNYLDIVPDERESEEDAFKDKSRAERYLYSCYGYLPNPRHSTLSIDLFTADEVVTPYEHETFAHFAKGTYTPSTPYISDWNTVFQGIRQCYLLIENIDGVPGMQPEDKQLYKAEATFLIGYYHYLLVKNYGPTIFVSERANIETSPNDFPGRLSYDESVNEVVKKFDQAIELGLPTQHSASAYGRATSIAAKAIKARLLVYAASPLFNGGYTPYNDPDADNIKATYEAYNSNEAPRPLFNTEYDASKWERAALACKDAIDSAEAAGYKLFEMSDLSLSRNSLPEPADDIECQLRMAIVDRETPEIVWASTIKEDGYSIQTKSTPRGSTESGWAGSWNGLAPTLQMVETFYTVNGLPIDQDPNWTQISDPYKPVVQSAAVGKGQGRTAQLHIDREPRFYAWISFHNGWYELTEGQGETVKYKIRAQYTKLDPHGIGTRSNDYTLTGYLNKKGVHPQFAHRAGGGILDSQYPWPIIRMAELYLNYAEALIEMDTPDIPTAIEYIDKVRTRAGIPGIEDAWGMTPDQTKMREIVRQERRIELYLENQRFWDVRRWLLGSKYFQGTNNQPKGFNYQAESDTQFFIPQDVSVTRQFTVPQNYLMPIPIDDLNKNPNLVQNPGYSGDVE